MTIQEKANECLKYLKTKKRDNGESFICQADNAPEWFNDLCREAHSGMLPDDYKYEFISDALYAISESSEDNDVQEIQLEPDIYNSDLLQWLSSSNSRTEYVDQASDNFGPSKDIISGISMGQYEEKQEVLSIVIAQLNEQIEDEND